MVVYTEFLNGLDTAIDQPQSMLLATGEAKLGDASVVDAGAGGAVASAIATCEIHLSIDQVVIRWWSHEVLDCKIGPHHALEDGVVIVVVIIVERHRANIDVIRVIRWTMYYLLSC